MNWWPWSRHHGIEPVQVHVSMPTVNTEFRALKPGIAPEKPLGPAQRLTPESDYAWVRPVEQLEDFHGPI